MGSTKYAFQHQCRSAAACAHLTLLQVDDIKDGAQMTWEVSIEREGSDKPVCVAESIARCY
jgi:acyl dehydratase